MIRTQTGGRGNGGTLILTAVSSEDDSESAAVSAAQAIIRLNQHIGHPVPDIVTDDCNVTIPEQPGNVSPIILEAGGATWAI